MFKEFRDFAMRGNVVDMAIGVIIGGAMGKVVSSLVNDVVMPPIGLLLGKVDFSNLYINLSGKPVETLAAAKAAGLPTINYGLFINMVVDFTLTAFIIFIAIQQANRLRLKFEKKQADALPPAPATKECPFCLSAIPAKAAKCAHCTSEVK